ncbi:MAG: host specificity factor TipJ family phage tail protein [Dechloromonas sp.]|nr:host specificity factor TipJ family phage tail protein [Dechloromonas sp.]
MILVYPSNLPGEPIERHEVSAGTLHDWLTAHCRSYRPGPAQPITATAEGRIVPPEEWGMLSLVGTVELRPNPLDGGASLLVLALVVGAVAVAVLLRPSIPTYNSQGTRGQSLKAADLKANTPRLNQVIPEIAGQYRVFPDYLCQPRRYFVDETKQAIDVMLCIGRGEYLIDPADIRIGETDVEAVGDLIDYTIFGPGQTVSGHPAHRNWYNAPEVGASVSSAGLRLVAGSAGTPAADAERYTIDGNAISVPPGAGVVPQDWEVGSVVAIRAYTRTITVVDGGKTGSVPNRDKVRGSFADLGLAANDQILIDGTAKNDGRYKIITLTSSVSVPGSASTIVGARVAQLAYAAEPAVIYINGYTVTLDADYADADALVTAINGQVGGLAASQTGGVITLTEGAPYSGAAIALSGYFDNILGASPIRTTGTATSSYDEMTLDRWQEATSYYDYSTETTYTTPAGWVSAGSMKAGTFAEVSVQKPRVRTATSPAANGTTKTETTYTPTEYRITSLITGALPDATTGTVGWQFQRLLPDGSDDTAWTGFDSDVTTELVEITFDGTQSLGGWLGPFRATPASEQTQTVEFDIFAPGGLGYINKKSKVEERTKYFYVQWRTAGGAWNSETYSVTGSSRDQLGWTFQIDLPAPAGEIEVRMRRVGAEDESIEALDRLEWYGLRSLLPAPTSYDGVTTMALTLEGSDKIASQTENQISLLVTRKLGGTATRSIAEWVRYVCESIGYSADDLNEDELQALADLWAARGDWYDSAIVDQTTVKEALATALRAGMSELTIDRGQIRPVRDQVRTALEHIYTPQNMTGPLSRKFSAHDPDDYDGVDVEYIDATTWEEEVVQCRLPGDVGVRVEKIKLEGVTDRTRAWRIGMRARRGHLYRRKQYSFSTELDALNSRYLSYCALTDDVPGYGQSALVAEWTPASEGGTLRASEPLAWEEGASHVIALRRPDGTAAGPYAAMRGDDDFEAVIADDLDFVPITGGAQEPTHVVFGKTTTWSYSALITDIEPSGDSVDVTAVNYDARIYADDDNSPPA